MQLDLIPFPQPPGKANSRDSQASFQNVTFGSMFDGVRNFPSEETVVFSAPAARGKVTDRIAKHSPFAPTVCLPACRWPKDNLWAGLEHHPLLSALSKLRQTRGGEKSLVKAMLWVLSFFTPTEPSIWLWRSLKSKANMTGDRGKSPSASGERDQGYERRGKEARGKMSWTGKPEATTFEIVSLILAALDWISAVT